MIRLTLLLSIGVMPYVTVVLPVTAIAQEPSPGTAMISLVSTPDSLGTIAPMAKELKEISAIPSKDSLSQENPKPFSAIAIALKAGSTGIGLEASTPLSEHINLRASASLFSYSTNLAEDGMNVNGSLELRNASTILDIYPFRNSFHISPGITAYNRTGLKATLAVPGGQSFSLGGDSYTSDPSAPINGTAIVNLAGKVAPRITMGLGNMIPRKGHFGYLMEIGFQYMAQPTVFLGISGNGCTGPNSTNCASVAQSDIAQEQSDLRNDLTPLRFYPILSIGVGYRFGSLRSR